MFQQAILIAVCLACLPAWAEISFNRDVRPIMSDTCFRCHGPDAGSRQAGLRLDLREEAVARKTRSGRLAIVPGRPDESEIIERVFTTAKARVMPPLSAHKDLAEKQKQILRQWVAEGAKYEGHWAWQPVRKPHPPGSGGHPIDAFILDRLAREGLRPAPEADRRTLLRRVTLDLTGLPPTVEEIRAFLSDTQPGAYERVVDRLLNSERYAEKQAMHWLDAARYADTVGYHGDNPFPAWPYRDYVLRAFRDNMPFDRFTREQLGGDLMPNPTNDQLTASAFNRLGRMSAEGGIQPKEYLDKYGADRVRTVAGIWMGATLGCAECHDHKFDPIRSRDFYAMKAFFADIEEPGLAIDRGPEAWGAKLAMPTPEQKQRLDELDRRIEAARRKLAPMPEKWPERMADEYLGLKHAWRFQQPVAARALNGAKLTIYGDVRMETTFETGGSLRTETNWATGMVAASGPNPDNETYEVTLAPGEGTWRSLGLETILDESLPMGRVARGGDKLMITAVESEIIDGGVRKPVAIRLAQSPPMTHYLPAMAVLDGDPKTGWGIAEYRDARNSLLALRFAEPLRTRAASRLLVRIRHDSETRRGTLGRFRLALSGSALAAPLVARVSLKTLSTREPVPNRELMEELWFSTQAVYPEIAALEAERAILDHKVARVVITRAETPRITRVLARGNFLDETGEIVEPEVPEFLGKIETGGRRANRLDLAAWLTSKENPLTARVQVNRLWRQFFGTGLSKTLDDFGAQGEWPTHPELLDWLAADFMTDWDMRRSIRQIVTSAAYRRASTGDRAAEEKDPDNRLLARQRPLRVDAESVRDIALAVSGLLAEGFGGPSVRPVQPDGYLAALNFPKRDYSASHGADLYRRGLYVHWQRSFLHPSLMTFDAPSREECTVNRVTSNTPLQALVLLNDPIFVEAAHAFAKRALRQGGSTTAARISWAFEAATGRPPIAEERNELLGLHARAASSLGGKPEAAMAIVTRALLNLSETITRN